MQPYCNKCGTLLALADLEECPSCQNARPISGWPADPLLGQRIVGGQFKVLRMIGAGGFGNVYEVETTIGRLKRAMKVLNPYWSRDEQVRQRFVNEAVILERLNHPHIARCYGVGHIAEVGRLFLLMEMVEGKSLQEVLHATSRAHPVSLQPLRAIKIAIQIASALVAAHAIHVLHRDLKPQNILLCEEPQEQAKLIDFGIAKLLHTDQPMTQDIVGTPNFMAPEQFVPGFALDARLDIWQLGAVLHLMLTGRSPYPYDPNESNPMVSFFRLQERSQKLGPSPSEARSSVAIHPDLDYLVSQMLATDREKRPKSAEEICERLIHIEHALSNYEQRASFSSSSMPELPKASKPALHIPRSEDIAVFEHLIAHPSQSTWWVLSRALARQDLNAPQLITGPLHSLASWPEALRVAPLGWWELACNEEHPPLWPYIRSLNLSSRGLTDGDMQKIARVSGLQTITHLDLSNNQFSAEGLARLLQSPHLTQLSSLNLNGNPLLAEGVQLLCESHHLKHLEELFLSHTRMGQQGALCLSRQSAFPKLRVLSLAQNHLDSESVSFLLQSRALRNLQRLHIEGNQLTDEIAHTLARPQILPALQELHLRCNQLTDEGTRALLQSPLSSQLTTLDLSQNQLTAQALSHLHPLHHPHLRRLFLSSNPLGSEGASILASTSLLSQLDEIALDDTHLHDAGAMLLLHSPFLRGLSNLSLAQNNLTPLSLHALAYGRPALRLQHLTLSTNPLGIEAGKLLATALTKIPLQSLHLAGCQLQGAGAAALLQSNAPLLKHLNLANNEIGEQGMRLLSETPWSLQLHELDLSQNHLTASGAKALFQLQSLQSLQSLSLNDNFLGDQGFHFLCLCKNLPKLQRLSVADNQLQAESIAHLVSHPLRKQLTSLDLSYNQIGDEGCSILGSSMGFERLRSLYIVQNELSIAGMLRITSSPTLWGLEEINLAQNYRENALALHSLPQDDVALLEESFASIASGGADLSRRFYENLFAFYPSVKPLFANTNMQKQQRHLLSALMLVIENLRNPEAIEEQLVALGERHIGYGALPSHYYAVIETLLETLQEFFADRWSEKLHSTWENGLQAVVNTLMHGHLRPKAYTNSPPSRSTTSSRPTASPQ